MLVATYFIAHATGFIVVTDDVDLVPRAGTATVVSWATMTIVWLTGVALFIGRIIRPAAVILALYTLCAALVSHSGLFAKPIVRHTLWVEVVMVGALAMIALTAKLQSCRSEGLRKAADDNDDESSRSRLELAATRAALAEIQASDQRISYPPALMRRSA
ncbi:hypothetical protein [Rhodovulum steppense]|nr:hypothetical protein [Rhodovulum steppense]